MNINNLLDILFYLKFFLFNNLLNKQYYLLILNIFILSLTIIKKEFKTKKFFLYNFPINLQLKKKYKTITYSIVKLTLISKSTKKKPIKKYKIISLIGNNSNYLGIGIKKNINLLEAIENSYQNAFHNIKYYPKILNKNQLNYFFFKLKNIILYKSTIFIKNNYFFMILFNFLNLKNLGIKCLKSINMEKIIQQLKLTNET